MTRATTTIVLACLTLAQPATADTNSFLRPAPSGRPGRLPEHDEDFGIFDVDVFALRTSIPQLAVNDDNVPRRFVGAPAPSGFSTLVGAGVGIRMRTNALTWPVFALRYAQSGDDGLDASATANGTPIFLHRSQSHLLQLELPWLGMPSGFQAVGRSAKFAVGLAWGASHTWSNVSIGTATGSTSLWSAFLRADFAACTRLAYGGSRNSLVPWACLTVSPTIGDTRVGWLPGTAAGVRLDL